MPAKTSASSGEKNINGKTFLLQDNEKGIKSMAFQFNNKVCNVTIADTAAHKFGFGDGKWARGKTTMHGPYLVAGAKHSLSGLPPFVTDGSYRWMDENTLELTLRFTESPHFDTYVCNFNGDKVSVHIKTSFNYGSKETVLLGELKN